MWRKNESWTVKYSGETIWGDPISGAKAFDTLEAAEQYVKMELEQDERIDYISLVAQTSYMREKANVWSDIL